MRWEDLFADLEAQVDAAEHARLGVEVADRSRRETARIRLADRLRCAVDQRVGLHVSGAGQFTAVVRDVGVDWLLVEERPGSRALIPASALLGVTGLGAYADLPVVGVVPRRLGLSYVLRGVARDRAPVTVVCVDGSAVTGTLDRVGADFVDVAEHPVGESRRRHEVRAVRAVAFTALGLLRSA